jgi:hypothetical protein
MITSLLGTGDKGLKNGELKYSQFSSPVAITAYEPGTSSCN